MTSRRSHDLALVVLLLALAALIRVAAAHASDIARADQLVHRYAPAAVVRCDGALDRRYYAITGRQARDVTLGPVVCTGLFLYDATPAYRALFAYANPAVNVNYAIGVGVLVALHEAQHAAGTDSEAQAECAAMRDAPALLDPDQLVYAQRYDASLPAGYHGASC